MKYYGKIQDPKDLVTKEYVDNNSSAGTLSGTCSTAASTASKIVVCPDFDTLEAGVSLFVTFTNNNTASNPTMNVNSTGAKAIKNGSSTDIKWEAGTTSLFMYDGTNWQQISSAGGTTFNGEKVAAIASDQIKIGDVVYTIEGGSPWTGVLSDSVNSATFSPDGTKLVLGGAFAGRAKLYSVSDNTVIYLQDIYADGETTALSDEVRSATFSPDGTKLVLGGLFTGYAKLYSVSGNTVTYISNIYANTGTTALSSEVYSATFSPDGTKLVLGGNFTNYAKLYSVLGNAVTFVSNIYADAGTTVLNYYVNSATFSPDGTKLVLGGNFTGKAKLYSVSDNTVTYLQDIYADAGTAVLSSFASSATFSPDGTKLVLGGLFTGYAKLYSVSDNAVTYSRDIYADAGTTALSSEVYSATFSPDGTKLVLGGFFTGRAKLYSVSGNTVTYLKDIYADTGTTALSNYVNSATFSPDGTKLVLGGYFTGYAKFYSVSGNTIAYLQDIYADTGTTALSDVVQSATFSPDGTKLVLGGGFTGYAKLYSVSANTISYIQDIYADAGTTALDNWVISISFSPDGTKLVLGGDFIGHAKLYSVSGNTVTFISNIYSDTGTTALGDLVFSAIFSPDGTKLVLGGGFTGKAKFYSVSGNTVTYLQDIYANTGTTGLSSIVRSIAFSPDGTKLVLGGGFTGYAKLYSVSGNVMTYLQDIYADAGTTALDDYVYTVIFSPDGTKLVLDGEFNGSAKLYSISGNTATYLQDIYADAGITALNGDAYSAVFSPDGTKLVLCGDFDGHAKLYSVSGNTVTFISNIYADDGTTALDGTVNLAVFSPDRTKLVLGGQFTCYAKLYSVSDNSVTYLPYGNYAYKALNGLDSSYDQIGMAQTDANAGANVTVLVMVTNGNTETPNYAKLDSPVFTGVPTTTGNTSYTTRQIRSVIISTSDPTASDGQNGDIWIKYS